MCTYISALSHARHAAALEPRRWQGTNGIRVGTILHHLCIVNTIFAIPHHSKPIFTCSCGERREHSYWVAYVHHHSQRQHHTGLARIHCRYCKQEPLKARPLPNRDVQLPENLLESIPISTPPSICRREVSGPQHSTLLPGANLTVTEARATSQDHCQQAYTNALPFRWS